MLDAFYVTCAFEGRGLVSAASMKLYRTRDGAVVESDGRTVRLSQSWDELVASDDLASTLRDAVRAARSATSLNEQSILAPIGSQEVWAAGVTYFRSRVARMEESKSAGGGDFYDRVYSADRPELFFKSTAGRVVGPGGKVRIRRDSKWNVPEPELVLVINPHGRIIGYTIGNDMSSRDIEGENPLYLPQAKVYDGSCAIGPSVLVSSDPLGARTKIEITIRRAGSVVFQGETSLAQMKRDPRELVEYLYRETSFPTGCYLLTGTGIVPPDSFTLAHGDQIQIAIEGIGELRNEVA